MPSKTPTEKQPMTAKASTKKAAGTKVTKTETTTKASSAAAAKKAPKAAQSETYAPLSSLRIVGIYVRDQAEALDFYVNKLGFVKHTDMPMGPDARWLTVALPEHPEVQINLMQPNTTFHSADQVAKLMKRVGKDATLTFNTPDCQKSYEALLARGVKFTRTPTEHFYGIDAECEDLYGNSITIVQLTLPTA